MKTFSLDSKIPLKKQFISGGALMLIVGIVVFFILPGYIPFIISGIGLLMIVGGYFATE